MLSGERWAINLLYLSQPHAPLQKADPRYYAGKCLDCQSKEGHRPAAVCRAQASGDCISCHMPGVSVTSHLTFVNHWIGIYRNGEKMKPAVRVKPVIRGDD
jgi:hypothetical protein